MENFNDIILDGSTATWDMGQLQGPIQGTYTGTFKFRCFLTPTQQLAAGREYRELLGPKLELAPEHEGYMSFALVQLRHRIIKAPPFWDVPAQEGRMAGDIPDINIILTVLNASQSAENKYREQCLKERDQALGGAISAAEAILDTPEDEQ